MIRKVYLDFIKDKIAKRDVGWFFKRILQYLLTYASFYSGYPLCGPILGTFVTNYKCNYRCKMCDFPDRDQQLRGRGLKELSTTQLKQLLKDFSDLGTAGIGFTGGEPLLREDIFELLRYAKELGLITHLNTNGSLLNEENVNRLLASKIDSVNISLDGATAKTHDTIRGSNGAFEKVIKAAGYIIKKREATGNRIRLKVVCVINELNIDEVSDIVKLAANLGTDCIEFIPEQPFSHSDTKRHLRFSDEFIHKVKQVTDYLILAKQRGVSIENSYRHLKLFVPSFKGEKFPFACFAAYNSYAVDCYGEIYPCMSWVSWDKPVGNIKYVPFKKFWYSKAYNRMRPGITKCRDCHLNCQAELNLLFNPLSVGDI